MPMLWVLKFLITDKASDKNFTTQKNLATKDFYGFAVAYPPALLQAEDTNVEWEPRYH